MILTNIVVKGLPRNAGQTTLKKYLEKEEVMAKWSKSAWAQKLATRQTRTSLSDFDRFKVAKLKNQVSIREDMDKDVDGWSIDVLVSLAPLCCQLCCCPSCQDCLSSTISIILHLVINRDQTTFPNVCKDTLLDSRIGYGLWRCVCVGVCDVSMSNSCVDFQVLSL